MWIGRSWGCAWTFSMHHVTARGDQRPPPRGSQHPEALVVVPAVFLGHEDVTWIRPRRIAITVTRERIALFTHVDMVLIIISNGL